MLENEFKKTSQVFQKESEVMNKWRDDKVAQVYFGKMRMKEKELNNYA